MYDKLVLGLVLALMSGNVWADSSCGEGKVLGTDGECYATSGNCGINCTFTYNESTKQLEVVGGENAVMGPFTRYSSTNYYGTPTEEKPFTPWRFLDVTDVNISGDIKEVSYTSFEDMASVKNVHLPEGLEIIGGESFHNTGLSSVNIPSTVKTIEGWGFCRTSLEEVIIPEGVTTIGAMAFATDKKLKNLVIPDSVTKLNSGAFNSSASDQYLGTKLDNLYCPKKLEASCKQAISISKYPTKISFFEKQGNDYLVYDDKGNIAGKYAGITALSQGTATETYKYDTAGHLVGIFDGNGQRTWGKKIYTVEEAMEVTKDGDKFHVYLTYK